MIDIMTQKPNGLGRYILNDGTIIEGIFDRGMKPFGEYRLISADGMVYYKNTYQKSELYTQQDLELDFQDAKSRYSGSGITRNFSYGKLRPNLSQPSLNLKIR